ncbi:MAG: acyltransferase [Flavobacteriales bacterium]|nr:acyltransferase [Flavobacteriales bacterium]
MQGSEHPRIFGLDLMRAVAIALVVYGHSVYVLPAYWPEEPAMLARDGVGLFFVLSGYLVGGIALRTFSRPGMAWWLRMLDFWQRRWLRTLPNYYLFLGVNIVLVHLGVIHGILNVNLLAFFVFLQNFHVHVDLLFVESWSLAVEEWFYLLLPLLLAAFAWLLRVKWAFLAAALVMLVMPPILRSQVVGSVPSPALFNAYVGMLVIHRLDAIAWGVLMAWLAHYMPAPLHRWRHALCVVGAAALAVLYSVMDLEDLRFIANVHFTAFAGATSMLLPTLAQWSAAGWSAPITFISRISYALYLVHLPVYYLGRYLDLFAGGSLIIYAGYWVLCIALAAVVYRYWERPFMALRDGFSARILGGAKAG